MSEWFKAREMQRFTRSWVCSVKPNSADIDASRDVFSGSKNSHFSKNTFNNLERLEIFLQDWSGLKSQ